jgi:phospholipid transport system substrate-binding protein
MTAEVLDAITRDRQLAAGDRQKALALAESKVLTHIDFREAARLAIGRNWAQATPAQQYRLAAEFRSMLIRVYSRAISAYEGQTMRVLPVRMKPGDTVVLVRNEYLKPGQPAVQVDYAMRRTAAGWKAYDITVEGISLVTTYRAEFDAAVKKDGIEGLIRRLMERNEPAKLGPASKKL